MFAMENALSHDAPPPMTSLKQGFHLFTGRTLRQLGANDVQLQEAVDIMGKRSARAQGLKKAITSYVQMTTSDHRLFLLVARGGALKGMMRVGQRQLFVRRDGDAPYCQINPTCVLDFYVHESCQRRGEGRQIYDQMIAHEGKQPHELGYDRPSAKFLGFLAKHFGLKGYVPQANNFVVYDQYWSRGGGGGGGERGRGGARNNGAARQRDHPLGGASGAGAGFPLGRSQQRLLSVAQAQGGGAGGGYPKEAPPRQISPTSVLDDASPPQLHAAAGSDWGGFHGRPPSGGPRMVVHPGGAPPQQRPPAVRPLPGPLPAHGAGGPLTLGGLRDGGGGAFDAPPPRAASRGSERPIWAFSQQPPPHHPASAGPLRGGGGYGGGGIGGPFATMAAPAGLGAGRMPPSSMRQPMMGMGETRDRYLQELSSRMSRRPF